MSSLIIISTLTATAFLSITLYAIHRMQRTSKGSLHTYLIFVPILLIQASMFYLAKALANENILLVTNALSISGSILYTIYKYSYYTCLLAEAHTHIQKELQTLEHSVALSNTYASRNIIQQLSSPENKELMLFLLENRKEIITLLTQFLKLKKEMDANSHQMINVNIEGLLYLLGEKNDKQTNR